MIGKGGLTYLNGVLVEQNDNPAKLLIFWLVKHGSFEKPLFQ
jgi:hypothetical protein